MNIEPGRSRRQVLGQMAALATLAMPAVPWAQGTALPPRRPWPRGQATPELGLPDLDGRPWHWRDVRGAPVLLNFWASWCEPCRAEMPSLELAAERFTRQGLRVLAINFRETDQALQRYLNAYPSGLTVLRDREGSVARRFGVRVFPTTVLVDARHQVQAVVQGEVDWTSPTPLAWLAELCQTRPT